MRDAGPTALQDPLSPGTLSASMSATTNGVTWQSGWQFPTELPIQTDPDGHWLVAVHEGWLQAATPMHGAGPSALVWALHPTPKAAPHAVAVIRSGRTPH